MMNGLFLEQVFNQNLDHLLKPCKRAARLGGGSHGLDGEGVYGTDVQQREYQEVAELMGQHILQTLSAGIVVEDAVLIGADAGEGQCREFTLDETVDPFRAVVLGGAQHIADEFHDAIFVDAFAVGFHLVDAGNLLVGVITYHDVFQQVECQIVVAHIGYQFHDVVDEVYEQFAVVVSDSLVDEVIEGGHTAFVSFETATLAGTPNKTRNYV